MIFFASPNKRRSGVDWHPFTGDEEKDTTNGRCFIVRPGVEISHDIVLRTPLAQCCQCIKATQTDRELVLSSCWLNFEVLTIGSPEQH